MRVKSQEFNVNGLSYVIRSAAEQDAKSLSEIRLQLDSETENLDREPGEAFLSEEAFRGLIRDDTASSRNIFLVADAGGQIVAFSRCEGKTLKRFAHKVEFGVAVLKDYWGYQIGYNLLSASISWADANGIKRIELHVLETNEKAIRLYKKLGFEVEGILRKNKLLSDGKYYDTVVMGRVIK
jgi:RimJ/RimL family protein N-acetyltransferase